MDKILHAVAGDGFIKMAVIVATDAAEKASRIHACSPTAAAALGRALCAASLLGESMAPLCDLNRDKVLEIAERIVSLCAQPVNFEAILQQLFRQYQLEMDFAQYVLVGSTVRSYLSWLRDTGRLTVEFSDGMLLWKAAEG